MNVMKEMVKLSLFSYASLNINNVGNNAARYYFASNTIDARLSLNIGEYL